ncbi:MAG: ParB/RepB/Spo0J family partition protein [Propionibacteriaceae bacterium]|nr:ParB/RepB/Spo0J family partition protein [Propionibacteriaceae bacterium]
MQEVPVARIRPEEGLGRKRDRDGHRELQRSIERFGVLTPITVRPAPDDSNDFLLIKGQGRTLACRLLGLQTIPAVVVDAGYAETDKVQQFLVENVARLKMRPVDRALLIQRARAEGEETSVIAGRFGVTASTVRRLLAQLDGATDHEVEALRAGDVNLAMHAVIARHVSPGERPAVLDIVSRSSIGTKEIEALFIALGWNRLASLGDNQGSQRLVLLSWACDALGHASTGTLRDRMQRLALSFPTTLSRHGNTFAVGAV